MLNALTVDVEEHFQVEAFANVVTREQWEQHPSRVVANTDAVLEMFAEAGVTGTFFVVGWVAERHPELLRRIASAGHEVGCHSHLHRHITRLSREEFREDAHRARAAIEDAAGCRIRGYRAPTFSIVRQTLWALEVLAEEGFEYDSSVFPVKHDLYGIPEAPRDPFVWKLATGAELREFPASTICWMGRNLPTGGGGYLRILPMRYTRWSLERIAREQRPAMVYFHPWEIDPDQPRLAAPWKSRLRHYTNLTKMKGRLVSLLRQGQFASMGSVLAERQTAAALPTFSAAAFASN